MIDLGNDLEPKKIFGKDKPTKRLGSTIFKDEKSVNNVQVSNKSKIIFLITCILFVLIILFIRQISDKLDPTLKINSKKIEEVTINVSQSKVSAKSKAKISINIKPADAYDADLEWVVEDKDIIDLNASTLSIYGKEKGKTKIYVKNKYIKSNVLEIDSTTLLEDIKIKNSIKQLALKSEYKYDIEYLPTNAQNNEVILESTNPSVIEVKDNLTIKSLETGVSKILFKDTFGNILKEEVVEVKWIPITKITLDETNIFIGKGQKYLISAKLQPENASFADLMWESETPSIASIKDGIITANSVGKTKIYVKTEDGKHEKIVNVSVVNETIKGDIKYASGVYDIFAGPSEKYNKLGQTETWENIEMLLTPNSYEWVKIRKKDGTPGYLKNSTGVLFDKLPILIAGINYTSATESKYLGASEVLSTFEMLKFYGITTELTDIINNIDTDTRTVDSNDSSPDNVFIGNMKKTRKEGTYGASAKYMKSVISKILKNNRSNVQLEYKKNLTLEEVKDSINNNTPIMLWMNDPLLEKRIVNTFNMNKNTIVIKGYNDNYIIVDDPLTSSNRKINIEEFKKILENSNIETITFKK